MGSRKYIFVLFLFFVVFFAVESADANVTRSCTAKYSIWVEAPGAIRGSTFDSPDFSGRGGCGAVVPNRCRDRASEKLIACFRAQFRNINSVPAECTSDHNVHSYPFSVSLQRYLQENVCRRYGGDHREITVRVNPSIRGNRHCDCNPWSGRVLDCTGSGPIRITCPLVAHIVPGAIERAQLAEQLEVVEATQFDPTAPTVRITIPTSSSAYSTGSTPLTVRGTASDAVGVTQVTWANSRGGSGACTGTTNWTCNNINLSSGANNITVTARDAAENSATDTLAATYTAPAPTVSIVSPTNSGVYTARGGVHIELAVSPPGSVPATSCFDIEIKVRISGSMEMDVPAPRYCLNTNPSGVDTTLSVGDFRIRAKLQTAGDEGWTEWREFTVNPW